MIYTRTLNVKTDGQTDKRLPKGNDIEYINKNIIYRSTSMHPKASVFEETYHYYLKQIGRLDLIARAEPLGALFESGMLSIKLFNSTYKVGENGVFDQKGQKPNFAISVVLARYILQCPSSVDNEGQWVTYREFKDASPLVGYFTANTNKIIEDTFACNLAGLEKSCHKLGGTTCDMGINFDLSIKFRALPRIPVILTFNDRDESFPAQATVLFRQSAEYYLDMECLCILGTLLAGKLVSGKD